MNGRRALKVETAASNRTVGLVGIYSRLYLWPQFERAQTFEQFCSSMLYFTPNVTTTINTFPRDKIVAVDALCRRFLEQSDHTIVRRLLSWYFDGTDPDSVFSGGQLYIFEEPIFIPDALKMFYDREGDECFMDVYRVVTRPLNQREQTVLEEKYGESVFTKVSQIPDHYPSWALRNIRVKTWSGPWYDACDCTGRRGDVMQCDKKWKFRSERSGRFISSETVFRWQPRYKYPRGWWSTANSRVETRRDILKDMNDALNNSID